MPSKPQDLKLRNAVVEGEKAECQQWSVVGGGECGRSVFLPAMMFDEGDARDMRRLAAWLEKAAAWVEERVR
jgi:hypothetical protein